MNKSILFLIFLTLLSVPVFSKERTVTLTPQRLPVLESLSPYNDIFKEYINIVDDNYKSQSQGNPPLVLFFQYKAGKDFSKLMQISSRTNILYETLATLNGITDPQENLEGKTLIIPTFTGLFVYEEPNSTLELILHEKYRENLQNDENVCYIYKGRVMVFIPGARFDSTERAYYTDSSMTLPLEKDTFYVSSGFGKRISPVTGAWKNHNGIDLAVSEGTRVTAVKNAVVAFCIKDDPVFGNYIILNHDDGKTTSVYAHLKSIYVEKGQSVKRGDVIGLSGQTGYVTGPHLHFEIRQDGIAKDPGVFLPAINR